MSRDPFLTPPAYEDEDDLEMWRGLVLRPGDEDLYGPERELWDDRQHEKEPTR